MINTQTVALELRQLVLHMLNHVGSGHTAGSLGMADIFSVLYFSDLLRLNPSKPADPSRDYIILSNGHICPIWYATLAKKGYFPLEELNTLRQFNTRLQGHPHIDPTIGIENTSGPLGQGISFAVGLALGLKHQNSNARVICLMGDGELNEGQCWEAFMTAAKYQLTNLTIIIDRNNIQIDGFTNSVMPLEPLKDKLTSFGLCTMEINGHNHDSIYNTLKLVASPSRPSTPFVIIAKTIPGKGVSFMEGKYEWHGKVPNDEQLTQALKELC